MTADDLKAAFKAAHSREPEFIARAPGRIEVIGNHTDYNGGPVLGAAIDRSVWVGVAPRKDAVRRFGSSQRPGAVELPAHEMGRRMGAEAWVNYPLGIIFAMGAAGLSVPQGFDFETSADVPLGAGLSSSAAIELASALAFLASTGTSVSREQLAVLGRRAENEFVGVPCGILDQGVSAFGRKDHLVYIDCRVPRFETVPLAPQAHFWVFNTHTKHALIDGLYAARHQECMEAARGIGVPLLADATPQSLAAAETRMSRASFKRARHVVDEIGRVGRAVEALRRGDLQALGRLLFESHRSSRTWFENSTAELDFLVDTLESQKGVLGARLSGGGFGGAVVALTTGDFGSAEVALVGDAYMAGFGSRPEVLHARAGDGAELVRGAR